MSAKTSRHWIDVIGDFHPNDTSWISSGECYPRCQLICLPQIERSTPKDCIWSLYVGVKEMRCLGKIGSDNNLGIFSLRTNELYEQTTLESLACFPSLNPSLLHNFTLNPLRTV